MKQRSRGVAEGIKLVVRKARLGGSNWRIGWSNRRPKGRKAILDIYGRCGSP